MMISASGEARTLILGFYPLLTDFGGIVDVDATETNAAFDLGSRSTFGAFAIGEPVSAIPEPSAYVMALAGLVLVRFVAHRRRNA
jgi:hypothetical protein